MMLMASPLLLGEGWIVGTRGSETSSGSFRPESRNGRLMSKLSGLAAVAVALGSMRLAAVPRGPAPATAPATSPATRQGEAPAWPTEVPVYRGAVRRGE